MTTVPQTTFSAQHTLTFDAALRDARLQLPATADATRADRGLVLALNGAVTLDSPTVAHVTSERDPEVVYHVTRWQCDCPDSQRRLAQRTDASTPLGHFWCKHQYGVALMGLAHVNLVLKGYVPEAVEVSYPAVSLEEWAYGVGGWAFPQADGSYWFEPRAGRPGWYTDSLSLELWDRTPVHVTHWHGEVSRWERWLAGR
jgi:hypothetical protein